MHWRAEPTADTTPTRAPRRAARPPAASAAPLALRALGLAVAALLTANGVVVAEQVSHRDLITLSRDGVSNAEDAIANLLGHGKDDDAKVAGAVLEQTTTSTTGAPDTTSTTAAPAAAAPPTTGAPDPTTTGPKAPAATTPTTAKKPSAGAAAVDWPKVVDTVRPYIEKETGLPFTGAVKVSLLDGGAFTARLGAVRLDPAVARAQRAEPILKALGIIEPGVNLADQVKRLSTGSVTAFYDPKANELIIKPGQLTPYMLKTIVHALGRADYDQHFELYRPNLVSPDDETGVAWDSLVEGTASRIEARFVSALPDNDKKAVQAEQQRLAGQLPKDLPDYVLVQYAFPFGSGPKFADTLMTDGGAARVNAAFQNPPTTSEQIIHPDKFLAGEGPKPLADPPADAPAIRSGSMGQLMISLMLAQVLDSGDAESAADGWGADRYVAWMNGAQTCVRLAITMDTPDKTTEMGQALASWAKDTPGAAVTGSGPFTVTRCV
ncbi:MAG TPA: hypothetical protein VHL53_01605 [Acidimicrobiia bacterium]|nr:hypothetical protein [Acidimicrobiia bacterium]